MTHGKTDTRTQPFIVKDIFCVGGRGTKRSKGEQTPILMMIQALIRDLLSPDLRAICGKIYNFLSPGGTFEPIVNVISVENLWYRPQYKPQIN